MGDDKQKREEILQVTAKFRQRDDPKKPRVSKRLSQMVVNRIGEISNKIDHLNQVLGPWQIFVLPCLYGFLFQSSISSSRLWSKHHYRNTGWFSINTPSFLRWLQLISWYVWHVYLSESVIYASALHFPGPPRAQYYWLCQNLPKKVRERKVYTRSCRCCLALVQAVDDAVGSRGPGRSIDPTSRGSDATVG